MRLTLGVALFLASSLIAAPAPFLKRPSPPGNDLQRLVGTWHRVSCTQGSFPPVAKPLSDIVVISPGQIVYNSGGYAWQLTLGRAGGKKTFDIRKDSQLWTGLYEIEGDTMRMCFVPSSVRPKNVQPSKSGEYLQVFRRKKPLRK